MGFFNSQKPISVGQDSVYMYDIDMENYDFTGWSGDPEDLFRSPFSDSIVNSTSDNPKQIIIAFNRTVKALQIGFGENNGGNFSNIKISLLGSGGFSRAIYDKSTDDTKLTSLNAEFENELFNSVKVEFFTSDTVSLSNISIQRAIYETAQIEGKKPDGTFTIFSSTQQGNFKMSIEEFENQVSTNNNTQLKTTIYDEDGYPASVDDSTETLQIIQYEHHEIHSGSHYLIDDVVDLAINNVMDIRITTPDTTKWGHFTLAIECESETEWFIYEDVAITTVGTAKTPINNNRNSLNASGLAFDMITNGSLTDANADTDLTGATELRHNITGAGKNAGVTARNNEKILKQNTIYCVRFISNTAGYVNYSFNWYEHTNKN